MVFNTAQAVNVVKTALDDVFTPEFSLEAAPGLADARDPYVFMQDTTDKAAVIIEEMQGPGYFEERSELENLAQANVRVGNQKTFSVLNYAKELPISKNLFDDDQHSVVQRMLRRFARNARLTQDKNAFEVYNNAFTTTLTNDGVALISASHVTLSGDTVSNLVSGALTESTLNDAIVSLVQQKTQDGTLGGHNAACLLVATAGFKNASEITKSELRSGTANNDMNYYSQLYPGLMVKHSPFLGAAHGGSDTAWFVLSQDHSVYRWVRQDVQTVFVPYEYSSNNSHVYKAEFREMVGPISYEGVVGSTGL